MKKHSIRSVDGVVESEAGGRATRASGGPRKLGELLVGARLMDLTQLEAALMEQAETGKRIGRILVEQKIIDERDLDRILAGQLGIDIADLGRVKPTPEAVALIPESVARSRQVAPLRVSDAGIEIVAVEPTVELRGELERLTSRKVTLLIAPSDEVQRAIDGCYRALNGIDTLVQSFSSTVAARPAATPEADQAAGGSAPVVQLVNRVITQALRDRASDVHIEPQDEFMRVRFRIDGALHDVVRLPMNMGPAVVSRLKIMAGMNIVERRRPQDGQIAMEIDGRPLDIRVATVATIWGEKCVLRLLDKSRPLFRLNDLGMPSETHQRYAKLIRAPYGMVICAGPTGSGKTTTLYASLLELNQADRNIMTVEDPVEYVFPSINQIQVNEAAGIGFAGGLKSILRQDPDIILVGEVRDAETARIAVQSALTGHFVLSSLHATDTAAALHRLLDMGIESFLIASSVTAIVAQRLLRRICTSCRVPYTPSEEEMAFWGEAGGSGKRQFWIGEGCNFCAGTGYRDRIGVFELMPVTPELKRLIVGWATQEELRRQAIGQGMRTLQDEGLELVQEDLTTISEVIRGVYGV